MIKGVIFDADGTLLDSMSIWDSAAITYLKKFNIVPEPEVLKKMSWMTLQQSSEFAREYYKLDETAEDIKSGVIDIVRDFYLNEVKLKPGVECLVKKLYRMDIPMLIATSGERVLLEGALKRLGLLEYFTDIYICSELNTSKNECLIYMKAAESLKLEPHETAVFEDALYAIKTAARAGFFTVAVGDDSNVHDRTEIIKFADIYIDDLNDFDAEQLLELKESEAV